MLNVVSYLVQSFIVFCISINIYIYIYIYEDWFQQKEIFKTGKLRNLHHSLLFLIAPTARAPLLDDGKCPEDFDSQVEVALRPLRVELRPKQCGNRTSAPMSY